jgi:hypothetical protein
MLSPSSPLPLILCCAALLALYLALSPPLPAPHLGGLLLVFGALSLALLHMSHRVAPKPASPPMLLGSGSSSGGGASGCAALPPLEFHRTLNPRAAARPLYHWQVPLPSTSAPGSRTHTAESAGSLGSRSAGGGQVGTDVTGPEDLSVSVGAGAQGREGGLGAEQGSGGSGGGGDGLRRRGGVAAGSSAAGVGLSGGSSGSGGGSSSEAQPLAFRKLYTGRSAGRLERIKSAKAARASATSASAVGGAAGAAAAPSPGSPPSTIGTVRAVGEGEEEEEGLEGQGAQQEEAEEEAEEGEEEEQRWAEEVAREGGADRSSSSGGGGGASPMDADARALFRVLRGCGLEGFFPALRAEALASLPLLQSMAAADPERVRRVLREVGVGRVGHREALVLALLPPKKGAATAAAAASAPPQPQPQQRLPGVKNEGLRAALGRLSVSVNEVGSEMPLLGRAAASGGGGALPNMASSVATSGLAPIV